MAIVKTLSFANFVYEFACMGRETQFSHSGLSALFDYLMQMSDDLGEPIELDVIALCCEWVEATEQEILKDFGYDDIDELSYDTTAIDLGGDVWLYQSF